MEVLYVATMEPPGRGGGGGEPGKGLCICTYSALYESLKIMMD